MARRIAKGYVDTLPPTQSDALCGAYVMGSLASLQDEEEFDAHASDIDIAIVIDTKLMPIDHERFPHGKFLIQEGCLIQEISVDRYILDDERKLLSTLGLGCNLRNGHIISDPSGVIGAAKQLVLDQWAESEWVSLRTERAIAFAEKSIARLAEASTSLDRLSGLADAVMQLAGLVAIASATTPTHRRALVLAATLLERDVRMDLHEKLLSAIGAESVDENAVRAALSDAVAAAEIEVRYDNPAVTNSPEFQRVLIRSISAGTEQIIREGYLREAMLPLVWSVAISAEAVGPVGSKADREVLAQLVDRGLEGVGGAGNSWNERLEILKNVFKEFSIFCRALPG